MNKNLHIGGVLSAIAVGVLLSSTAFAHEAGKANDSYVGDKSGHYITDSAGNCVRTSSWKKEDLTVDCGAEPVVQAKAPPPPPPAEPVYEKTTLSAEALFDHDKSNIKPAGEEALEAVAENIRSKGASLVGVDIVGHTDSDGTEEYNQKLSIRRATAVRDFIIAKYPKVDPNMIHISGMGETSPVADNKTSEGRAQNRRVEVSVGVKMQQ